MQAFKDYFRPITQEEWDESHPLYKVLVAVIILLGSIFACIQ